MTPEADPLARGFPRAPEPFGTTANRTGYVPRPATESALQELGDAVRGAAPVTLFTGPPGIGKTLLLHVLGHRLEPQLRVLFLPYAALGPEELCAVALDHLGAPRTEDASGMLRAYARHLAESGSALVLLVDDANAVPDATLAWCCETARAAGGAVRCVFALTDDVRSSEVGARLGAGVTRVRLDAPMTPAETADYVQVQLAVGRASGAVRDLFDDRVVAELHRASGGVPRRLHTAAQALLRRPTEAAIAAAGAPSEAGAESAPAAAAPERSPGAGTVIDPALREEIDRLRRDAGRPPVPPAPAPSRDGRLLAAVFGLAVVLGLLVASATRPLSTWVVPGERGGDADPRDTPSVRFPAATRRAVEGADRALPERPRVAAPVDEAVPPPADSQGADGIASLLAEVPEPPRPAPAGSAAAEPAAAPEPVPPPAAAPPPAVPEAAAAAALPAETATVPPVAAGVPAVAAAAAPASAPPVAVNINATPWARIEVDGEDLGETPLAGVRLSPGPHRFRATLPDGRVIEREVVVDPDDPFLVFDERTAP